MMRWILLSLICALPISHARAEIPTVASSSATYAMESTTAVTGVSQQSQTSGSYQVSSELDSNALVPVELSNFTIE